MAHKNSKNKSPYAVKQAPTEKHFGTHKKPEKILSFDEANDRLYDIFRNHDFGHISHEVRGQLARFYQLLMDEQHKQNFTRLHKLRDVAIKHFIDCLIVADLVSLKKPLLDIGTGPGFPGIPLKIYLGDEHRIILAEGVQKRVEFLKTARESLELKNLDILGKNIDSSFCYPVQGIITRAVEECSNTLENVINSLQVGGKVYLMKGPHINDEVNTAKQKWREYYRLEKIHKYELPKTPHERSLVVFEKIKAFQPDSSKVTE